MQWGGSRGGGRAIGRVEGTKMLLAGGVEGGGSAGTHQQTSRKQQQQQQQQTITSTLRFTHCSAGPDNTSRLLLAGTRSRLFAAEGGGG